MDQNNLICIYHFTMLTISTQPRDRYHLFIVEKSLIDGSVKGQ